MILYNPYYGSLQVDLQFRILYDLILEIHILLSH